jgi:hypothetical protein
VIDRIFTAEVSAISWFAHCGAPLSAPVPFPVQSVATWKEAAKFCAQPVWADTTLEAGNVLTVFLHHHAREDFERWNEITIEAKLTCVIPLSDTVWKAFAEQHGLGQRFISSVQWDVLSAILEHEYRHVAERPTFFLHLLALYRAGHFPCGWIDGEFPNGTLLVF